ncbi:MAG TPA: M28 family metallopeptidase [Thermoanaerobaculia bacterium]|nr:M28 family metallopeptidase [Thermoanaerobaculia bacterium]
MRSFLLSLALSGLVTSPSPAAGPTIDPGALASALARLGPRPPGTAAHAAALALLSGAMVRAGLTGVSEVLAPGRVPLYSLTGVLPGATRDEIVLSAHYDTVPRSPGAGDDASGCGTVLAAVADLARTPLQHTVRVLLLDGEETGGRGSRAWLAALGPAGRDRILAAVNLEMVGWRGSAGPVIQSFPVRRGSEWALAPGWLVHALLTSGGAVGWRPSFVEAQGSLPAQLVLRATVSPFAADSDEFVAAGVPAVTLSDSSSLHLDPAYHRPADTADRLDPARLDRWVTAAAAAGRRLDRLAGRPLAEDQYLVACGRVWLRRDLYWVGFLLWGLLVFRQRAGLPGFIFRLLLLAVIFVVPVFSVLLYPAALLAHVPSRRPAERGLRVALGLAPAALLLVAILYGMARGLVRGYALGPFATLLLVGTLAAWAALGHGQR